ncbi:hypothetical protein BGX27_004232 [Mortierella sp. AM989]|nr:hypothetical protein BGX27_004232 [Mortierella sp. AM989]
MAINPREYVVQQWPRYIVGLFASYDILNGLNMVLSGIQYDMVYHSGDEAVTKASLLVGGSLSIIFSSITLYAAIRKSATAAKFSFVVFCYSMGLLVVLIALMTAVIIIAGKEVLKEIPPIGETFIFAVILGVALQSVYGWSLLVLLRDTRGQARNKWGRLLTERDEDIKSAGPIKL